MALIKCPECNHDISDQALFCPHCGLPFNKEKKSIEETPADKDGALLCTFNGRKSFAGSIVAGVICELCLAVIIYFAIFSMELWFLWASIAFAATLEVCLPFAMIHDIKRVIRVNSMCGKGLYLDEESKSIFIRGNDNKVVFTCPLKDLVNFDGPQVLVITYRDTFGYKKKFVAGITNRETVLRLRNLLRC